MKDFQAQDLSFPSLSHTVWLQLCIWCCGQDWDEPTCSQCEKAYEIWINGVLWVDVMWGKVQSDVILCTYTDLDSPSGNTSDKADILKKKNRQLFNPDWSLGRAGQNSQKCSTIKCVISIDTDNYHNNCKISISFKFKGNFFAPVWKFKDS